MRGKIRLNSTEEEEQAAVFQWATAMATRHPELRWMYAVPNGGQRHARTAARLKWTGTKSGVPDICLPVARSGFHALYIEMKANRSDARLSATQIEWKAGLAEQGNLVVTCFGWESAVGVIEMYLAGKSRGESIARTVRR